MEGVLNRYTRMCRLCMSDEDVLLYVIHENPDSKTFDKPLRSRIRVCLGISVFPFDNLPQFICHHCLYKVDSYYKFKEDCLQRNKFLKAQKKTVTPLLDREVKQKRKKNPSEYSDLEEYEDEPPVIVVKKKNCEAVDDLADPLALSDSENNSQQKGELDSCAGAAPSSLLNAEVIEKIPFINSSETSSLGAVTENASQEVASQNNSRITIKKMSQCKFIDVEDVIQKQREARKTQARQAAKCTVSNVRLVRMFTESEHCVTTHITDGLKKKFTCSLCSKGFSVKFSLKRHMFTHSHVKPFRCPNCDCAYSDKSNLIKHQRKRHSDVGMYKCSLCQAVFPSNSSLVRHRRTSHFVKTAVAGPIVVPHSDHDCYTKRERNHKNPRSEESMGKNVNKFTNEDKEGHGEVIEHEEIDLKEELPEGFTDEGSKSPAGIDFPFVCNICFLSFQSYVEFDRHMTEHKQGTLIREKWNNTHDAFMRSLRKKSGQAATTKYLYADFLHFLLKISDKDETESSICGEGKNESTETQEEEETETAVQQMDEASISSRGAATLQHRRRKTTKVNDEIDIKILKSLEKLNRMRMKYSSFQSYRL